MTSETARAVETAAALYGVETGWVDTDGEHHVASTEVVLEVLARLGAPVTRASDLADAVKLRRRSIWERACPPVRVVTEGEVATVSLRLPAPSARGPLRWQLVREDGRTQSGETDAAELGLAGGSTVDGRRFEIRRLELPGPLPMGHHRLVLRHGAAEHRLPLVVTPPHAFGEGGLEGSWGLFHPLFGLRSGKRAGVGDFGTLRDALRWSADRGAALFGTTPLLAGFEDSPVDPSPYAPASRRFWNELYVDVEAAPGYGEASAAGLLSGLDALAPHRADELVPWEETGEAIRSALDVLAGRFFAAGGERLPDFQRFLAARPETGDFARFMAARNALGPDWRSWPEPARSGRLSADGLDVRIVQRHLFGQWVAERQLEGLAETGAGLYLDVPLGTHPGGYDAWRQRDLFVAGVSVGAPPDEFFRGGQDWGLPPLHPERVREDGFRHFAEVLRHAMRHAALVRIDHVMQLHRLFWVPSGRSPEDGVYVRYPADEMAGVLALESHRARCEVVGEDLGTVPDAVREIMDRRGLRRTAVLAFGLDRVAGEDAEPITEVADRSVATIETHDMFPLAGLRLADDVVERQALGLIDQVQATRLRRRRETAFALLDTRHAEAEPGGPTPERPVPDRLLAPLLAGLGASRAGIVVVPLDDLFGRRRPQNVPGTTTDRANWRQRLPAPLGAGLADEAQRALAGLAAARRDPRSERVSA